MSLEHAVRRLTFESASTFGIYDRGLLRPGLAADITIFDPDTINPLPEDTVHDFPAGGWRIRELATGQIMEAFGTFRWDHTQEQYLERIYNKTAALFRTAARRTGLDRQLPALSTAAFRRPPQVGEQLRLC